jgi:hypothetical protein
MYKKLGSYALDINRLFTYLLFSLDMCDLWQKNDFNFAREEKIREAHVF